MQGGDVIAVVDWAEVDAAGLPKTTMVLITNTANKLASMTRNWQDGVEMVTGAEVGTAMAK